MLLETLTKALSDQTRLRILLLLAGGAELCVCELTQALALAQPKISRHLAILRESGLLLDRKAGLWVYYRLHPELPGWTLAVLEQLLAGSTVQEPFHADRLRLAAALRESPLCA
ncbi:MAG TPA: metalloregulator ArsR/SmtB family transcription factor [Thiolinea sp.]|nr:metalloregulator ArsR/SmtB family transcription factor [Thiolinea sp.]